MNAYILINVS